MKNKRGYEFSYAWIFAIIIGAAIIFLAIYTVTQVIGLERFKQETKTGKKLGILLNPIATNLEQAKFATIIVPDETKVFNNCTLPSQSQFFGSQDISISAKQGNLGEPWPEETGAKVSFHNRFLFSSSATHANEEFYVLSKPFLYPFKIADLMILWSDKEYFCFDNPPAEISNDIERLDFPNIVEKTPTEPCPPSYTTVCFQGSSCSISVNLNSKTVTHGGSITVNYEDSFDDTDPYSLLYAAIFSNPEEYECQVQRLVSRASTLANLYKLKSENLNNECGRLSIQQDLEVYSTLASSSSTKLNDLNSIAGEIKEKNDALTPCRLFEKLD